MPQDESILEPPYYPIIYVRGYAFSQREVDRTVEDPYMGFNLGATKRRREARDEVERFVFESPMIRLMKDYGYEDVYSAGSDDLIDIHPRSVVIFRYYEALDSHFSERPSGPRLVADWGDAAVMEARARDLAELIWKVRDGVCGDDATLQAAFRVHLVAHSMGGLICRCLLQKFGDEVRNSEEITVVDKVFTYATPHNGVDAFGWNYGLVPPYFRRPEMKKYLDLVGPDGDVLPGDANTLNSTFDADRMFCLVGTDWRDYDAVWGVARFSAGEGSDGLVKIDNAKVVGARFNEVHRSHSGPHGIVNSSEGYENLARFLFGFWTLEARVDITRAPQDPSGPSDLFIEATVATAGGGDSNLTERRKDHWSAERRSRLELIASQPPPLFTLSFPKDGPHSDSLFTVDLAVSPGTPEGASERRYANLFFFRKSITLHLDRDSRRIRYQFDDQSAFATAAYEDTEGSPSTTQFVPLISRNGFEGRLVFRLTRDYEDTAGPRPDRSKEGGKPSPEAESTRERQERRRKEQLVRS